MLHTHRWEIERYRVLGTRRKRKGRGRERGGLPLSIENCVSPERVHLENDEFRERFSFVERRKQRARCERLRALVALVNIWISWKGSFLMCESWKKLDASRTLVAHKIRFVKHSHESDAWETRDSPESRENPSSHVRGTCILGNMNFSYIARDSKSCDLNLICKVCCAKQ